MLKAGFCISWASSTCRCLSHSRYTCIRLPGSRARRTPRHYNTPCTAQCTIIKPKCQVHQQFHFSAIFSNTPSIPHSLRSTVFHSLSFSIDDLISTGFLFVTFFNISPPLLATFYLLCLQRYRRPTSFRYHCSGCLPRPLERERQNLKMTYHRQTWPVTISIDGSDVPEGKHKPTRDD